MVDRIRQPQATNIHFETSPAKQQLARENMQNTLVSMKEDKSWGSCIYDWTNGLVNCFNTLVWLLTFGYYSNTPSYKQKLADCVKALKKDTKGGYEAFFKKHSRDEIFDEMWEFINAGAWKDLEKDPNYKNISAADRKELKEYSKELADKIKAKPDKCSDQEFVEEYKEFLEQKS